MTTEIIKPASLQAMKRIANELCELSSMGYLQVCTSLVPISPLMVLRIGTQRA